jgi:glycyl-tRNA synthetase beta chain
MPNLSPYLIELGCEEIPARFVEHLLQNWVDTFSKSAKTHHLPHGKIHTLGSYRRLTLKIEAIPDHTPDQEITLTGPPAHIAWDEHGALTPAGLGFLKKNQASADDTFKLENANGTYLGVTQKKAGQPIQDILPRCITESLAALSLPISMKWGTQNGPFIRPIKWILSLHDTQHIPISFMGVHSHTTTRGHRMLTQHPDPAQSISGAPLIISHPDQYEIALQKEGYVIACPQKRETLIRDQLQRLGCSTPLDELVDEVKWITECPTALEGQFDASYLDIPAEVLIETMTKNQRYFGKYESEKLTHTFIVMAENVTDRNRSQIIQGNEQVLKARLEDALFFWKEDLKTPLSEKRDKLKAITFQKNMGSIWDKTERVKTLGTTLFGENALFNQAAELSKADLTTHMVYEFGSLQGIMGEKYALKDGLNPQVAKAIGEQYTQAQSELGWKLGLADRLDTIACCFIAGLDPTGSRDPWGIRQSVYSIIEHLLSPKNPIHEPICLDSWIQAALTTVRSHIDPKCEAGINSFIEQRLFNFLKEAFPSHAEAFSDLLLTQDYRYIHHKAHFLSTQDCTSITALAKRVHNITQKETDTNNWSGKTGPLPIETEAVTLMRTLESKTSVEDQWSILSQLSPLMEHYFNEVLVMEPSFKTDRIRFLVHLNHHLKSIADFTKISPGG